MRMLVNASDLKVISVDGQDKFETSKTADGLIRLVDDKPVYALRNVIVKFRDENGSFDSVQNASVKLFRKPNHNFGELETLQFDGCVRVTPYVNGNNRLGLSIMADGIKEAPAK